MDSRMIEYTDLFQASAGFLGERAIWDPRPWGGTGRPRGPGTGYKCGDEVAPQGIADVAAACLLYRIKSVERGHSPASGGPATGRLQ